MKPVWGVFAISYGESELLYLFKRQKDALAAAATEHENRRVEGSYTYMKMVVEKLEVL